MGQSFYLEVNANFVDKGALLLQADDLGVDKPHQFHYSETERETSFDLGLTEFKYVC